MFHVVLSHSLDRRDRAVLSNIFLVEAPGEDAKMEKPLDDTVRTIGRLPDYMTRLALEAGNPAFKADPELFKTIKTSDKNLLTQLFYYDTLTSPRMPIATVNKLKLLEWLALRREVAGNQLGKMNLKRAIDWAVSGHFRLKPDAGHGSDLDDHCYTHVEYTPTKLQVTSGSSNFEALVEMLLQAQKGPLPKWLVRKFCGF